MRNRPANHLLIYDIVEPYEIEEIWVPFPETLGYCTYY